MNTIPLLSNRVQGHLWSSPYEHNLSFPSFKAAAVVTMAARVSTTSCFDHFELLQRAEKLEKSALVKIQCK